MPDPKPRDIVNDHPRENVCICGHWREQHLNGRGSLWAVSCNVIGCECELFISEVEDEVGR